MKKRNSDRLEGLFALLLFGVFAVCLLAVLLTGAGSYGRLTQRDRAAAERRTCAQYLTTRVRQSDAGAVSVAAFGDGDALCLGQTIGGREYVTWVYVSDGWLMELFCAAQAGLGPEDGERVMAMGGLSARMEGGLLAVDAELADGRPVELLLSLRSGEGGGA